MYQSVGMDNYLAVKNNRYDRDIKSQQGFLLRIKQEQQAVRAKS